MEFMNMFMFDEGEGNGVPSEPTETPEEVKPTQTEEPTETPKTKNEILRELSKELGVNLFEAEGVKQIKTLVDSQKTEQQKLQEQLSAYEEEKAKYESTINQYEAKLKASQLGIKSEYLEDALKLADNDPSKLDDIVKKFPIFKTKGDISIGVNNQDDYKTPTGDTEVEQYLAEKAKTNPEYAKYMKKNRK